MQAKVVWQQGMLLHPQHFQQQERYFEDRINALQQTSYLATWGFIHYEIDIELLRIGKIALVHALGLFRDGTWFKIDRHHSQAPCIDLNADDRKQIIYLALPLALPTEPLMHLGNAKSNCRYNTKLCMITDCNNDPLLQQEITLAEPQLQLLRHQQDRSAFTCLPISFIEDVRSNGEIILNNDFVPPCLDIHQINKLAALADEISNLIKHRIEMLACRLTNIPEGDSASFNDLQLLQTLNRYAPKWQRLSHSQPTHPRQLYEALLQLSNELATFTEQKRYRWTNYNYQHECLTELFSQLASQVRRDLNLILEQHAKLVALQQNELGWWIGKFEEDCLYHCTLILALQTDNLSESERSHLPQQIKTASLNLLDNLISRALPGISLQPMSVAPRQIPYHPNYYYFSLQRNNALWDELIKSNIIAIHISGEFSIPQLELWIIKE